MFRLDTKVTNLNRVGIATARQLAKLGVTTINDLIYFFPFRYEDYSIVKKIE